jgi:hypothetical protein
MLQAFRSAHPKKPIEIVSGERVGGAASPAACSGDRELAVRDSRADAVRRDLAARVEVTAVHRGLARRQVLLATQSGDAGGVPQLDDGIVQAVEHELRDGIGHDLRLSSEGTLDRVDGVAGHGAHEDEHDGPRLHRRHRVDGRERLREVGPCVLRRQDHPHGRCATPCGSSSSA